MKAVWEKSRREAGRDPGGGGNGVGKKLREQLEQSCELGKVLSVLINCLWYKSADLLWR